MQSIHGMVYGCVHVRVTRSQLQHISFYVILVMTMNIRTCPKDEITVRSFVLNANASAGGKAGVLTGLNRTVDSSGVCPAALIRNSVAQILATCMCACNGPSGVDIAG